MTNASDLNHGKGERKWTDASVFLTTKISYVVFQVHCCINPI